MKNKIFLIALISILCLELTGCFGKNKKSNEELAFEYLTNTYSLQNDTFTFINCGYDLFPGWNDRCYFKSEKYNDSVTVSITKENDEYTFIDNYYTLYMLADAKLYFKEIASNLNDYEVKIIFTDGAKPADQYMTFKEYNDNYNPSFSLYYITNYDIGEQQRGIILNNIANKNYGFVYFYVTNDLDLLRSIDLDIILNNQNQYIESKNKYYIDINHNIQKETN